MNEILMRRICRMIAMAHAVSEETVWETFLFVNSIDKTLEIVAKIK